MPSLNYSFFLRLWALIVMSETVDEERQFGPTSDISWSRTWGRRNGVRIAIGAPRTPAGERMGGRRGLGGFSRSAHQRDAAAHGGVTPRPSHVCGATRVQGAARARVRARHATMRTHALQESTESGGAHDLHADLLESNPWVVAGVCMA